MPNAICIDGDLSADLAINAQIPRAAATLAKLTGQQYTAVARPDPRTCPK